MAMVEYRTVSVNSESDIISEIIGFADDNGWETFPGDGIIGHTADAVWVRIWDQSDGIRIKGGRSYGGSGTTLGDESGRYSKMTKTTTYGVAWSPQGVLHLFAHENPRAIFAVLNYATDAYQTLAFGMLEKYGQFDGGQWYFGTGEQSHNEGVWSQGMECNNGNTPGAIAVSSWPGVGGFGTYRLYVDLGDPSPSYNRWAHGNNWNWSNYPHVYMATSRGSERDLMFTLANNTVNEWNAQTVFLPCWNFVRRPDELHSLVGRTPGVRVLRARNFNREEVVTVGEQSYKIFPVFQRRTDSSGAREWSHAFELPPEP